MHSMIRIHTLTVLVLFYIYIIPLAVARSSLSISVPEVDAISNILCLLLRTWLLYDLLDAANLTTY